MTRQQAVERLLWASAFVQLAYFTASHWFFHRYFFHSLGIHGQELESTFVISQLRLIGMMVMGYAGLTILVARNPSRHRPVLAILAAVGAGCATIFIGSVIAGTLPVGFLANAVLLLVQVAAAVALFPPAPERAGPPA